MYFALSVVFVLIATTAGFFQPRFKASSSISTVPSRLTARHEFSLASSKPDLFSDDLFDDEDAEPKGKEVAKEPTESPRKKYLDQKWKLNNEDAKDFKGFPKKEGSKEVIESKEKAPWVPCMALMYKFRKEYVDNSCDEAISAHKGHCAKFKRILNSEALSLGKSRGCVILWAGFSDTDKADLKAEIMTFMEEDPLITKDIVDNWDLIDLDINDKSVYPDVDASASERMQKRERVLKPPATA